MQKDVVIFIEDQQGTRVSLALPTDMGLSLMEGLKAYEYPILATCGGMALCATCHVEVLENDAYQEATDVEWEILDTLPFVTSTSRLACQMRISQEMHGMVIKLWAETADC